MASPAVIPVVILRSSSSALACDAGRGEHQRDGLAGRGGGILRCKQRGTAVRAWLQQS